ncbi:ABC transporter ATP-binding protein [Pseudovibrio sp. POLY-S9]|uniref:ABC transporter ATP-binding protein n=1 Tax=Pseudovibrio sp. POLY-S9 TaxID=1576596 RepID=UPI0007104577|nr:ABC transporter ATP-binding protein [Pseudovibrio sp. POLY-S9]
MLDPKEHTPLEARGLGLSFGSHSVLKDFNLTIPKGQISVVIGPNSCGKSTLLRSLARLEKPNAGTVLLDGKSIHKQPTREVAKRLGILPQMPVAPEGITVGDLVSRGRTPHQSVWRQWSRQDEVAIQNAMDMTKVIELRDKPFSSLSGGQRQRVWIAMALAQETDLLLLDEPTTFLDLAHQIELLELLKRCNEEQQMTIVAVLHDINLAARYAHNLIVMKDGQIEAQGNAAKVITQDIMKSTFGLECYVMPDPVKGTPLVVPA